MRFTRIHLSIQLGLLAAVSLVALHIPFGPASSREQVFDLASREFVRGDANQDAEVDISDASYILNYLFLGEDAPECLASADLNDDAKIDISDPVYLLLALFVGTKTIPAPYPEAGLDPTTDLGCRETPPPPLPEVGSPGGPDRALTEEESEVWRRGFRIFDRPVPYSGGLGPLFNGDSCRGCHLDPVVGGAGGIDVNVVRFAHLEGDVVSQIPGGPAASRHSTGDLAREECPAEANVIESRQTPTVFGLGLLERVPDAEILSREDPDDLDGDGISGRARRSGDLVGRFGHKAAVPTLRDFAADALANELGVTVSPALSTFALGADTDQVTDPELPESDFDALAFFIGHLAPPARRIPEIPEAAERIAAGEQVFAALKCSSCHVQELAGADGPVRAFTDLLLHDVADPGRLHVNEPGVDPREFRTAPLWGLRDTAPYLHDGSAGTLDAAIRTGHFGEAAAARDAYASLSQPERAQLLEFLGSL